jgi:outer membrane protein insertion porin family
MTSDAILKLASRFLLLLALAGVGGVATGQTPSKPMTAAERQLVAIQVTGSKRFPESAIAAQTGLQIGTAVNEDDFKRAARRLGDTGAFTDVGYKFSYSSAGTKLEFQVTDAAKFVPARFEDFVWFSDDEILRQIKEHVPLFAGELPVSGRMADEVSDVLQAMLVEGAIPGHVNYVRGGKPDGPVESIDYSVADVLIRVRKIEFTGVSDAERPALDEAAQKFAEREYSRGRLDTFVQQQLLPVFYARGYLRATCGPPQPKVVKLPAADSSEQDEGPRHQTIVDVTYAVTPGQQYKVKTAEWSGNHEFTTAELAKLVHLEGGQPANTIRLADDLKSVQQLYGSRGFITLSIKVNSQFDDASGTVAMILDVKEGPVFHMGELEFRGLDNSLTAKLRAVWKIRQGDVYDATYLDEYLPEAHKLLPTRLDWEVAPHVTANGGDKTVDVDLIYSVKAPN